MKTKTIRPATLLGIAAYCASAIYIAYTHIQWESSLQAKKAMAALQGTFLTSLGGAIYCLHQAFTRKPKTWQARAPLYLTAAILPILGFEGGMRLRRWMNPYRPQARPVSKSISNLPVDYFQPSISQPLAVSNSYYVQSTMPYPFYGKNALSI